MSDLRWGFRFRSTKCIRSMCIRSIRDRRISSHPVDEKGVFPTHRCSHKLHGKKFALVCCWCIFPFKICFSPVFLGEVLGAMATVATSRTWGPVIGDGSSDQPLKLPGMRCSKKDNESSVHTQQRLPLKLLRY